MISLDIEVATFVIQIIATVVLFLAVKVFFTKPMKNFLDKRRKFIEAEFEKAQHAFDEANQLKAQADLELKKIQEESEQMIQEASEKARIKYDAILEEAKTDALVQAVKMRNIIEKERQDMYYDAKKEIAKTANAVASKLVKKEMDQQIHDDLFGKFVQLIGGGHHGA